MTVTYEKPADVPEVLREALCWHEVFRRLGVQPGQLFIAPRVPALAEQPAGVASGVEIAVAVRQGQIERGVLASARGAPDARLRVASLRDLEEMWAAAVNLWNRTCNTLVQDWAFEASLARGAAVGVVADFVAAGFVFSGPGDSREDG